LDEMEKWQRAVIAAAIGKYGVSETARRLGLSAEAVLRLAGDFGSHQGTELLAINRLGALDDPQGVSK
jgi:hypothetical protein